ncbi:MAG: RNA polymerase sigma factor FliA [bacterium]
MNGYTGYANVQGNSSDALAIKHTPLVKRIAYHLAAKLPDHVQIDDLIQAGMIGLIEASRHFDPSKGASFETYAGIRIRGAIIDEVRTSDWTPRSVSRNIREMAEAIRRLENRLGRQPTEKDIARELDMTLEDYQKMARDASIARVFSIDEMEMDDQGSHFEIEDSADGPSQRLSDQGFREALVEAIKTLPEREGMVMSLYYEEELNLREIGEILGVSESRVSQIHGQTLARLKSKMTDWVN